MEVELKFLVDEAFIKDKIFQDAHLQFISKGGNVETIHMRAIYFDTEDQSLLNKEMAYRIRYEDQRLVATLKWGGSADHGLHVRGELNVPVNEAFLEAPSVDIFHGSAIYEELKETVGEKKLFPVMEMDFVRKEVHVDTGKSISVVSYDEGQIKTSKGNIPISELEIELYSGCQEDMMALGNELAQKYNLKAGNKSKYQRGLECLGLAQQV